LIFDDLHAEPRFRAAAAPAARRRWNIRPVTPKSRSIGSSKAAVVRALSLGRTRRPSCRCRTATAMAAIGKAFPRLRARGLPQGGHSKKKNLKSASNPITCARRSSWRTRWLLFQTGLNVEVVKTALAVTRQTMNKEYERRAHLGRCRGSPSRWLGGGSPTPIRRSRTSRPAITLAVKHKDKPIPRAGRLQSRSFDYSMHNYPAATTGRPRWTRHGHPDPAYRRPENVANLGPTTSTVLAPDPR